MNKEGHSADEVILTLSNLVEVIRESRLHFYLGRLESDEAGKREIR